MTTGYTLPVFACASAIAALRHLQQQPIQNQVTVNLIKPPRQVEIEIEQVAKIHHDSAIAITRSDPGDHLDLTRNTPIWAKVTLVNSTANGITIEGGEGIGKQQSNHNQAAIYSYAQELITENLQPLLNNDQSVVVTIILLVQPLTAASQLEVYQEEIKAKAALFDSLVFCIGENGIDLAQKSGIDSQRIIKTANWMGSMLVNAAAAQVKSILLFGYHGKLIKLAGGIFHTHNHLADGRREIMTAYCAKLGLPQSQIEQIFNCATTESALSVLREIDNTNPDHPSWVNLVYSELATAIDDKCVDYIHKYTEQKLCVGSVLFDRSRQVICQSENALLLLAELY